MPNVPNVPGVPILRAYSAASSIILLTSDLVRSLLGPFATRWGIFRNGLPVIDADNMVRFEFRTDYSISDYPIEAGGFQSYNKVGRPSDIRVRISSGGSEQNRQALIESVLAVMSTTDLYDVVTPEKVFIGYNFDHCDWHRAAKENNGLLPIDVWLKEIRETATSTFSNPQQPGVAGQQGVGHVQPQVPSDRVTRAVNAGGVPFVGIGGLN